ncbi:unnamed protein product, partial [Brenthis ino]
MQIRKIEDIIDIQKANGKFRQVAFKLPSKTDSSVSASLAKSLESGLSKVKQEQGKKKSKRSKNHKHCMSDVISWPSDSDITVLRMKICSKNDMKDKMGNVALGDGLHHPDSSSMVNLATLILQSQPPSKHSLNVEEYLLPLSSWEHGIDPQVRKVSLGTPNFIEMDEIKSYSSSRKDDQSLRGSEYSTESSTKSKVARFLRLYFCPCCSCLYNLEKVPKKQSVYFRKY